VEGDKEYGCETMPIVIGTKASKMVAIVVALIIIGCLGYVQTLLWNSHDTISFYYFQYALQIPLIFLIYKIAKANNKPDFRFAGNLTKLIMLIGICYLFVFASTLNNFSHAFERL
jgi:4-hydroxybenzoate polyprenyltransferase